MGTDSAPAAEFILELFNPAGGVDKAFFTGVDGMGIHGDIADNDVVLDAVYGFLPIGRNGRLGQEILTCGNVAITDGMGFWMDAGFHGKKDLSLINPGAL